VFFFVQIAIICSNFLYGSVCLCMSVVVCRRSLEATYGISIRKPKEGEDANRPPTDLELLNSYGGGLTANFRYGRLSII